VTPNRFALRALWFLVAKDLVGEFRARRAWPAMLLLGLVLVVLVEMQIELPSEQKHGVICGLFWLDVFFAGTLALERSLVSERDEGCWRTLFLYPISPALIFMAKMAVNFMALVLLELVLIPAFVVFANVELLANPLMLGLVAVLGNLGFVSVGVTLSALTNHSSQKAGLLALILLPLLSPVLVAAAEATRLAMYGEWNEQWWSWIQLLAAFAVLFTTLGLVLFPSAVEE
jgi:heme exporter protein B